MANEFALMQVALQNAQRELDFAQRHPFRNRVDVRYFKKKVQAIQETQRDVLSTAVTGRIGVGSVVDKNNYPTYAKQVEGAYKMYDGLSDYGHEVVASVVDIRVALIAGEGISFYSDNPARSKFVKDFLKRNNLSGSKLLNAVLMGELEGKALFTLKAVKDADPEKSYVAARLFSWYLSKYTVKRDPLDTEKVVSITYKQDNSDKEAAVPVDKSIYVKLGGSSLKDDQATTKIGKVLTQCENASRTAYDLRNNTHLFGKVMPYWETKDNQAAHAINNDLKAKSFEIGDAYAGTAKMGLLEPSGSAADAVIKDMLNALRYVASMTGVPIHWLAWPELMSNRATAENMLEVTSAATKRERLIWEEAIRDLIEKVCQIAVDELGKDAKDVLEGNLVVKLPLISLASMQQIVDVWLPLMQEKVISLWTLRNMLPSIDPEEEDEQVAEEKDAATADSPFNSDTVDKTLTDIQKRFGGGPQPGQPGFKSSANGKKGVISVQPT